MCLGDSRYKGGGERDYGVDGRRGGEGMIVVVVELLGGFGIVSNNSPVEGFPNSLIH
jgi:hypothetical protein